VLLAASSGPITSRTVVDLLGFTKQAASQLIDAMERDGYVDRRRDPSDARAKVVSITAKGARLLAEVEQIYAEIEAEWSGHVGEGRMAEVRATLTVGLAGFYGDDQPPVRPTW
jgi:DNA-binding MarR family transcriptional regulator